MHLCVADLLETGEWRTVEILRSSLRLGQSFNKGAIPEELIQEALSALSGFAAKAALLDAEVTMASATASLREATNQLDFVNRFEAEVGWPLRVLSGVEEAAAVYRGTRPHLEGQVLLFDLGGRSTELIWGQHERPDVCLSLPVGHLGLSAESPYSQPCSESEWVALQTAALHWVGDISDVGSEGAQLASPSGAVRTLARMAAYSRGESTEGRGEGLQINAEELALQIERMRQAGPLQLSNIPGIDPRRADSLLAAAALVQALMLRFSKDKVLAAPGGLREGLILEWADGLKER